MVVSWWIVALSLSGSKKITMAVATPKQCKKSWIRVELLMHWAM